MQNQWSQSKISVQSSKELLAQGFIQSPATSLMRVEDILAVGIAAIPNFRRCTMKKIGLLVILLVLALPLSGLGVYAAESCDDRNPDLSNVIIVDGVTLGTGEFRQYDKIHLKKGDSVSADLQWDNSDGNVYLAVGAGFGQYMGLQSSEKGHLLAELIIVDEGDYYVFVGVQQTHETEARNIRGQIVIHSESVQPKDASLMKDGKISIDQVSLTPGSHKTYGPYTLKKGDVVSIDVNWEEPGNIYFAIGKEFGHFRGLKTSGGEKNYFNDTLKVNADGVYYIFVGIQNTEIRSINGLSGEISYPLN